LKVTIIKDKLTKKSKGYAFIEFSSSKEYNKALNNKNPIILKKQKLIINSGKNKYDEEEEDTIESTTIDHSEASVNISQITDNLSNSLPNINKNEENFSFINNKENIPNFEKFFRRKNEEEYNDNIKFLEGFKSVCNICKKSKSKVNQISLCNYYCNLIFSNFSYNNVNCGVNLYNGLYNCKPFFPQNQLYYKYFSLKPVCFPYSNFESSL
jgi:RNA recognition motif-containing protein